MSEFLRCDAPGCDHSHTVDRITALMVGEPCPKCGANLLTQADYIAYVDVFRPAMDAMMELGLLKPGPAGPDEPGSISVNYHDGELTVKSRTVKDVGDMDGQT